MTKEKFMSFYSGTPNQTNAGLCWDSVESAFKELYKKCSKCGAVSDNPIVSPLVMAGAMATIRIEVGKAFLPIREYASNPAYFKKYDGRADLGNTIAGDGEKFKGRGFIQLTGRANYTVYGQKLGIDLVNNPDLALEVGTSAKILAQYFIDRKVDDACLKSDWLSVRKLVNGVNRATGLPNGWEEFRKVISQYIN